jgi:hypothetical protein
MALNFRCEIYSAGHQTLPDAVDDQEAKKILQVQLLQNESTVFVQDVQANEAVTALRKTYNFYNDYFTGARTTIKILSSEVPFITANSIATAGGSKSIIVIEYSISRYIHLEIESQ